MKRSVTMLLIAAPLVMTACVSNSPRVSMDPSRGRDACPEGYYKTTYGNGKHCTLTGPPPKTYNNPKPVNGRCPSNYSLFLGGCVETYLVNGLSNTMSNYKEMLMGFGYFDPSCPPGWVRTGNWCENPRYKR
jgi:hypothetical protein